jgi:pimeloyl-ACP methyl ester carboxylesterase
LLNPHEHAYPLQKAIKNSKLVVLPETGHQLPQTQPEAVVAAVDAAWSHIEIVYPQVAQISRTKTV